MLEDMVMLSLGRPDDETVRDGLLYDFKATFGVSAIEVLDTYIDTYRRFRNTKFEDTFCPVVGQHG